MIAILKSFNPFFFENIKKTIFFKAIKTRQTNPKERYRQTKQQFSMSVDYKFVFFYK